MDDSVSEGTLTELVAATATNLPGPAKATLLKALNRLTGGLVDIPAAVLEGWSQSIRDKTTAKSTISKSLAASAAKELTADELTMAAVRQVYVPEVIRKTRNRIEIARRAAEEIREAPDEGALSDPDEDWINTFSRHAEDASSERLQRLFARILAGELRNRGSFSTASLRTVSELDPTLAADFAWAWDRSIGAEILREEWRGEPWLRVRRLRDAGLLSPVDSAIWQPDFNPTMDGASPWGIGTDEVSLQLGMRQAANIYVNVISFSNVGLELGSLLPQPSYSSSLRELSKRFANHTCAWVVLVETAAAKQDVLWKAEDWTGRVPHFSR